MPRPAPAPQPPLPARHLQVHRGLSLRPRDAIDPYALRRFAPDLTGIKYLTIWCPGCDRSLELIECYMTDHDLYAEGICYWCSNRQGHGTGIYKRLRIPMRRGVLPGVDEED